MLLKLLPFVTLSLWYDICLEHAEAIDFCLIILVPQDVVKFIDSLLTLEANVYKRVQGLNMPICD